MKRAGLEASDRRICQVLGVPRSALRGSGARRAKRARSAERDAVDQRIWELIQRFPTFGYRRVWALLRFGDGLLINRKAVYRRMRRRGWMVHQRQSLAKPRVRGSRSTALASNMRWATNITHIPVGRDGWAHLTAVIDCHDREIVGWEIALRGRVREAERSLEDACLRRFGTLRPNGPKPVLRSDNGLVSQSKRFRAACRDYGLSQEFITPYTPEQNGMIERFFRSLKGECVWQHRFACFDEARRAIASWIRWYNHQRPHQSLSYQSPLQYRSQQPMSVA